jgi:hypothetical protein
MTSAKERDKDELLSLREHVSALQKDLTFAEDARKSILEEKNNILECQKEAASPLEEKNIELEQLLEQASIELQARRSKLEQLSRSCRLNDQLGETPGQRHDRDHIYQEKRLRKFNHYVEHLKKEKLDALQY